MRPPVIGMVDKFATFEQEKALRLELSRHCGHKIAVTVKRVIAARSNQQCRAVMGVWMPIILEELGYHHHDKDRVYEWCKLQFWFEDHVIPQGEKIRMVRETHTSDAAEYSLFMIAFQAWAHDYLRIQLPDPDAAIAMI